MNRIILATLIAIAMSSVAPVSFAADGAYVSARMGISQVNSNIDVGNMGSRVGWQAGTSISGGKKLRIKYEANLDGFGTRELLAGVSASFGDIEVAERGRGAFYNHVSSNVDKFVFFDPNGMIGSEFNSNIVTYAGEESGVKFSLTLDTAGGSASLEQIAGTMKVDKYVVSIGKDDDTTGFSITGKVAGKKMAATLQKANGDVQYQIYADLDKFYATYGSDGSTSQIGIGYQDSLGSKTTLIVEANIQDGDTDIYAAIKYDWGK